MTGHGFAGVEEHVEPIKRSKAIHHYSRHSTPGGPGFYSLHIFFKVKIIMFNCFLQFVTSLLKINLHFQDEWVTAHCDSALHTLSLSYSDLGHPTYDPFHNGPIYYKDSIRSIILAISSPFIYRILEKKDGSFRILMHPYIQTDSYPPSTIWTEC